MKTERLLEPAILGDSMLLSLYFPSALGISKLSINGTINRLRKITLRTWPFYSHGRIKLWDQETNFHSRERFYFHREEGYIFNVHYLKIHGAFDISINIWITDSKSDAIVLYWLAHLPLRPGVEGSILVQVSVPANTHGENCASYTTSLHHRNSH